MLQARAQLAQAKLNNPDLDISTALQQNQQALTQCRESLRQVQVRAVEADKTLKRLESEAARPHQQQVQQFLTLDKDLEAQINQLSQKRWGSNPQKKAEIDAQIAHLSQQRAQLLEDFNGDHQIELSLRQAHQNRVKGAAAPPNVDASSTASSSNIDEQDLDDADTASTSSGSSGNTEELNRTVPERTVRDRVNQFFANLVDIIDNRGTV